jgi:hypothetical protein
MNTNIFSDILNKTMYNSFDNYYKAPYKIYIRLNNFDENAEIHMEYGPYNNFNEIPKYINEYLTPLMIHWMKTKPDHNFICNFKLKDTSNETISLPIVFKYEDIIK